MKHSATKRGKQSKRKGLNCILAGENPRLLIVSIMSYFDESVIQLCCDSLLHE
jgi:hypothetical protein